MKKNDSPKKILETLKKAKKIFLTLHDGPDGDSLGACSALKYVLERDFKKEVTLVSPTPMSEEFALYPFYNEVEVGPRFDQRDLSVYDLVVFLDFGALFYDYLNAQAVDFSKVKVLNIDHHEANKYYGDVNYVDERGYSTCSMLIHLFKKWKVTFDEELSSRLLLGVYTDSAAFSLDERAIQDAAFLIDQGARYLETVQILKFNVSLKLKKYLSLAALKFEREEFLGCTVGYSLLSIKDLEGAGLELSDVRLAPNYLQEIAGIDFLFTIQEMNEFLKGSFRSTKKVDVSRFARELGGGGHRFAAAFRLPKMDLEKAKKKVFEAIQKVGVHRVA